LSPALIGELQLNIKLYGTSKSRAECLLCFCRLASMQYRWGTETEFIIFRSFRPKTANTTSANITFRRCTTW